MGVGAQRLVCWPGRSRAEPLQGLCSVGDQPRLGCSCGVQLPSPTRSQRGFWEAPPPSPPSFLWVSFFAGWRLTSGRTLGWASAHLRLRHSYPRASPPNSLCSSFQLSNKETSLDVVLKPSPGAGEKREGMSCPPPRLPRDPGWATPACEADREAFLEA